MVNKIIDTLEAAGQAKGNKAWAWLRAHWYAFAIGAAAGSLGSHFFWH